MNPKDPPLPRDGFSDVEQKQRAVDDSRRIIGAPESNNSGPQMRPAYGMPMPPIRTVYGAPMPNLDAISGSRAPSAALVVVVAVGVVAIALSLAAQVSAPLLEWSSVGGAALSFLGAVPAGALAKSRLGAVKWGACAGVANAFLGIGVAVLVRDAALFVLVAGSFGGLALGAFGGLLGSVFQRR